MKLVPLEDRILVERLEAEETTKSGIVLPDTAQEKPTKGQVLAVGPGKYSDKGELIPIPVKEGDVVVFAKYAGTELRLDGDDYLVMRATDLIGILTD